VPAELCLVYLDGKGILREALAECASRGFSISNLSIWPEKDGRANGRYPRHVTAELELRGQASVTELASDLTELDGIVDVHADADAEVGY
jgi:putative Mg2+ transporter-C (MgtC) family protein